MVPRRAAQQRVAALALPLPAGGVSLRGPDRGERPALQAAAGVRAAGHRHLRRRPVLDRRGPLRQGRPDRRPGADHRPQPGARGGLDPRAAHAVVPQRVVVGPGRRAPDPRGGGRRDARSTRRTRSWATTSSTSGPDPDGTQPELLFCENETNDARIYGDRRDHAVPQGRHQRPRRDRRRHGEPGRDGHEGGGVVPPHGRARRHRRDPAPPAAEAAGRRPGRGGRFARPPRRRRSTRRWRRASPRPTTSTRTCAGPARRADEATVMRQAFAGMLWSKQFYAYDVARWLEGDPGEPAAAERAPDRSQRRLAPLRRRGHPLDARQVGVPVVRGVGPRVPHDHARARRPGVRQVPAARHVPRVVPAPQRRPARVRVVVRRRQPAGPRPGRARGLEHRRAARHGVPEADLPQAAAQLHLVAEPPGLRGQRPVLGRLPRPRQPERLRPVPPAGGGQARAVRRDRLDVRLLHVDARAWPSRCPAATPPTATW